jgi:hypothetical protein
MWGQSMIRFKYKLYQGQSPSNKIRQTFGNSTQMFLGQFPTTEANEIIWIYGEVMLDILQVPALEIALVNWQIVVLTDQLALSYADSISPLPDAVICYKHVQAAASIIGDRVQKPVNEVIQ